MGLSAGLGGVWQLGSTLRDLCTFTSPPDTLRRVDWPACLGWMIEEGPGSCELAVAASLLRHVDCDWSVVRRAKTTVGTRRERSSCLWPCTSALVEHLGRLMGNKNGEVDSGHKSGVPPGDEPRSIGDASASTGFWFQTALDVHLPAILVLKYHSSATFQAHSHLLAHPAKLSSSAVTNARWPLAGVGIASRERASGNSKSLRHGIYVDVCEIRNA